MESALEHHLQRLNQAKFSGREADFGLDPEECRELFHEGTLYYFRYVRLFQLKDWARTVRDTSRNLRAFDFLHRYAQREEDQQFLEKWRPYVLRVYASAVAMLEVDKDAYDEASRIIRDTIRKIESLDDLGGGHLPVRARTFPSGLARARIPNPKEPASLRARETGTSTPPGH